MPREKARTPNKKSPLVTEVSQDIKKQTQKRAASLGMSVATYLRTLIYHDLDKEE